LAVITEKTSNPINDEGLAMDNEEMVALLEATGDYRILRRLKPRRLINDPDDSITKRALFVDVETTGLAPDRDEIIELAMVPFTYSVDGRIFDFQDPFQGFQEPSEPISAEITRITGIEQSMVGGQRLDLEVVNSFVENADIVIAHNAAFDRRFCERLSPTFKGKAWGCSATQIDWRSENFEGSRLGYLVANAGYFYERHRALNDCYAAIELLATRLPVSGKLALDVLLEQARAVSWRIWANHAPFELKDNLKRRGYKWSTGKDGTRRAWYIDVSAERREAEIEFLRSEIYRYDPPIEMKRIDAFNRFSERA
jgi:DNA polymerase-3 subunit epsilon